MKAKSKEVYSTQFDPLENRMNYTNTDDNSITEIKSREIPVDPCDKLAVLHWVASLIAESSLGILPKQPVSPCFGAETKDLHGVKQICNEFRNSSSFSALESGSCSGNIPTCILDVTAPRKKRSIRARVPFSNWGTRSLPLVNCNPVMVKCQNISVSVNAAVSDYSDFLSSEQAKSQSSNKISESDRKIEAEKVIKCMHCGTQETPQWRAGPMDSRALCNACGLRYRHGKLVPEYRPRPATPTFPVDRKCVHCGKQETPQWRSGPIGPGTLCNSCGVRYRSGKLPPEYRPKLVKCMHCGTQKISKSRCNACGSIFRYGRRVPEDRPSSSSTFSVYKHSEAEGQKEFTSQASEAKQTSSGTQVLENCPNSSLLASSGSDYSVSKQTKSDSNKGIMRKGQHAMNARKCVDCGNQRTMDSVTPCNTCGVKYRSERNSPEYSPVASPEFSADKDSYSDKLVLERKAQKELVYQGKQTHIASQLQDSCAEPPQTGLGNQPKSFLSDDASKQVDSDPLRKIRKTSQGIIRKVQKAMKVRKCLHCSIKKTPQWRDGPMGPKTLCNACGVRYRAGKLLTEYRPAGSSTFSANKHSNSHKKSWK